MFVNLKGITVTAVIYCALFMGQASAATCLPQKQSLANAAIKIHSELMVTALNCMSQHPSKKLVKVYENFSRQHRNIIQNHETSLIQHFNLSGNGTRKFDTYRTKVANDISKQVFQTSPYLFCKKYLPNLLNAAKWDGQQFKEKIRLLAYEQSVANGCQNDQQYYVEAK